MKKKTNFGCVIALSSLALGSALALCSFSGTAEVKAEGEKSFSVKADDVITVNNDHYLANAEDYMFFALPPSDLEQSETGDARYKNGGTVTLTTSAGDVSTHAANIAKPSSYVKDVQSNSFAVQYRDLYYLQFDNWSGDSYKVNIGDTITLSGEYARDNGDTLTFSEPVSFTRTADGYFRNGENQETVNVSNSNITSLYYDNQDSYGLLSFALTSGENHITVDGNWDFNHNRGYDLEGATVEHSDGTTDNVRIILIKSQPNKYSFLFVGWAGSEYKFVSGDVLRVKGSVRFKDAYDILLNYDLDLKFTGGTTVVPLGDDVEEVVLDYTDKVTSVRGQSNYLGDGTYNGKAFYIYVDDYFENDDIPCDWTVQLKGHEDVTITSVDGTVKKGNTMVVKYQSSEQKQFCFEFMSWGGNDYDLKTRDEVSIDSNSSLVYESKLYTFKCKIKLYYAPSLDAVDPWVTPEDAAPTLEAAELIKAIGTVDGSDGCKAKIEAAEAAVEALDDRQSALLLDSEKEALANARKDYESAIVQRTIDEVVAKIEAIGEVTYSSECKAKIEEARNSYESLSETVKEAFPADKLKMLEDAETAYQYLADEYEAKEVVALIKNIGTVEYTYECKAKIDAARIAYNNLTEHGKELVSEEDYAILLAAEARYNELKNLEKVNEVVALIDNIGQVDGTSTSKYKIEAARSAYEELSEEHKSLVPADKLKTLEDAEASFASALSAGKESAKGEIDAYLASIDMGQYSSANATRIQAIATAAKEAIDASSVTDGLSEIVSNAKAQIAAVEKTSGGDSSSSSGSAGRTGCGGSIIASASASAIALAGIVALAIKRRKEDK